MKNLLGLYPNLSRAIQIAKLGDYSVSVYYDDTYKNGLEDYKLIKNFCSGWFDNFVVNGDIKIKIEKPFNYETKIKFKSLEEISIEIEKISQISNPLIILDSTSELILKTAIDKLELSLAQIDLIKKFSATIAKMDNSEIIQAYHIAEAIQISYIYDDCAIHNAELCIIDVFDDNDKAYKDSLSEFMFDVASKLGGGLPHEYFNNNQFIELENIFKKIYKANIELDKFYLKNK